MFLPFFLYYCYSWLSPYTVLCICLDFIFHFSSFLPSFQSLNRSVNNILIFLLSPFLFFILHFALCFSISFFQSSILTLFLSLFSYALYLFSWSLFLWFFLFFSVIYPSIAEIVKSTFQFYLFLCSNLIIISYESISKPLLMAVFVDLLTLRAFEVTLHERIEMCSSARGVPTCLMLHSAVGAYVIGYIYHTLLYIYLSHLFG